MASLLLVRHGQASYFAENYDQLSPLGEQQAQHLARHWLAAGRTPALVLSGSLARQRRTEECVAALYREAGQPWPAVQVQPGWNEFDGIEVMRHFLPLLARQDPEIAALSAAVEARRGSPESGPYLDQLFQRVARAWIAQPDLTAPHIEPWPDFCGRVADAIEQVRQTTSASTPVVVFTSGGVIAAAMRVALDLSPFHTLELVWQTHNTAYAEFQLADGRLLLTSFNSHPHLLHPDLLTYR